MSASFFYRQASVSPDKQLSVWAPGSFRAAMESVFCEMPFVLAPEDKRILEGMAAVCSDGVGNPYRELIEGIEKYGRIEVCAEG